MAMKPKIKYLVPLLLAVLLIASGGTGYAQGPQTIQAAVDRTDLSTDETLTLMVTVNASVMNAPRPALPDLQGFDIVGSSSSSQISMINGDISSQLVYSYRLRPYQAGDLVIDPIDVMLNGQVFATDPITVHVTQGTGTAAPAPQTSPPQARLPVESVLPGEELSGQDLFVTAEVDDPTPYVGQQVVYTFRLYQAVNPWGQPQYEAPSFQGFWAEQQSDQQEYRVQAAGRIYQVSEVRTILFPSVVGPVTIEPARLTTPGSFFRSGRTLQTDPVVLDVQPLPPNAPESFAGAVGQFALTGAVDSQQGRVNEPLTWRVTLSGRGNVNAAPDPAWPEMSGWRDFESAASIHTEVQEGQVVGSRVYERLLVPSKEGESAIPPLTYTFFDPVAGEYQTVSTEATPVLIAPGVTEAPPSVPVAVQREAVEQVASDIRHLKPAPSELSPASDPITRQGLYWAAWAFPLIGAAGYFAWQRRQRYWENNLGLARSSQARKKARRALTQARKQRQGAYEAAGQILTTYLADKLDRPVAGLTHQALADLLAQQGVKTELIERIEVCLVSSELGRFAPGADSPDHAASLLKEVSILIDALEQSL